jgi:hypothetical protein
VSSNRIAWLPSYGGCQDDEPLRGYRMRRSQHYGCSDGLTGLAQLHWRAVG